MRRLSASTRGKSSGRSMRTACAPPPPENAVLASSTAAATPVASGETDRVPASMRPASRRSLIRPRIRSACSSMTRKNCSTSAGSSAWEAPSTVVVEPLMAASGVRSSWLTMPRNSDRSRSTSSSGARSCMVTTTDTTSPSPERIGVTLMSVRTLRPSGTESTTSSARIGVAPPSTSARGSSASETSRPSAKRHDSTSSSSSAGRSGACSPSTMRRSSRLSETGRAVLASSTATPTGEVSTRASRSPRARCSSVCARALATAVAAWAANSASTSSSSAVNSSASSFPARKKWPTWTPRWRIGVASRVCAQTSPES